MPRPTRAQGRPGTRVIPVDFGSSHAPVVRKTFTAVVQMWKPSNGTPTINADLTVDPAAAPTPYYDGGARIQVLNGQEAAALTGDQEQTTLAYLVVVDLDVTEPVLRDRVKVTACPDDPSLVGRVLTVRRVTRGSVRWERDLYCVDDLTTED